MNTMRFEAMKVHPNYAGLNSDEIAVFLSPFQAAFCAALITASFNVTKATRLAAGEVNGFKLLKSKQEYQAEGLSEKAAASKERQNYANKGVHTLKNSTVSSYLAVKIQELKKIEAQNFKRSFAGWVDELEDLRTKAKENDDYGTALRAHMNLGTVLGHTEGAPDVSKVSESELVKMIAGDDETLAIELGKKLGIKGAKAKAIEGELVSK